MAKGALTAVNQSTDKQVQGKSRKTRHLLQESTNKQISEESNLGKKAKKIPKDNEKLPKAAGKIDVAEKENTPLIRRSKRKIALDSKQNADSSSLKSKTTKSSTKSVQSMKTKSKCVTKLTKKNSTVIKEESRNEVQSNLPFTPVNPVATNKDVSEATNPNKSVGITSLSGLSEDSGFESSSRVSDQIETKVVLYSPGTRSSAVSDNEASVLACETPPLTYWRELAEQRRIALETALYENESLHDQLAVLEAENSQLKQLTKECEEFADIVKAIIK